jgi:hypothetical protein
MKRKRPEPPTFKPCPTCGRVFKVHACTALRGGGKYCSKPCRQYQGSGNPNWKGGRVVEPSGRVLVYAPGDPHATWGGGTHAYEYRLVAAQKIGRPLLPTEIVHHVDGDPTNNHPDNLEVMTQSEHCRIHFSKRSA